MKTKLLEPGSAFFFLSLSPVFFFFNGNPVARFLFRVERKAACLCKHLLYNWGL